MGRPMICVSWSSTSNGDGPIRKYRSITPPVTCQVTRVSVSDTSMALLFSSTIPCAVPSAPPAHQGDQGFYHNPDPRPVSNSA